MQPAGEVRIWSGCNDFRRKPAEIIPHLNTQQNSWRDGVLDATSESCHGGPLLCLGEKRETAERLVRRFRSHAPENPNASTHRRKWLHA